MTLRMLVFEYGMSEHKDKDDRHEEASISTINLLCAFLPGISLARLDFRLTKITGIAVV